MPSAQRITSLICLILLFTLSCNSTRKIQATGHEPVDAKQWSKIDGKVHYSDWKTYYATTLGNFKGFKAETSVKSTIYGSDPEKKFRATGFFYTIKDSNRWWIIDPIGNAMWNVAVNGVRPGSSSRNEQSLQSKYGTELNWIAQAHKELEEIGFNGTACWSENQLVKSSNLQCKSPLSYTMILSLYAGYQRQAKKENNSVLSFAVFSPEFEEYVDNQAKKLTENKDDPNLLGYFSDNELSFNLTILDEYLAIKDPRDPHLKIAHDWLRKMKVDQGKITDQNREMFLGIVAERYYKVVTESIKKYDPHHMYLGSRLHGKPKHNRYIVAAAGKFSDILSINYYGHWEPVERHFEEWNKWAGKPVIITEFYIKGDDSELPNISGAGWRVKTQEERGIFYENFCIRLLQMKNCVGWHWFRYMDNDPTDSTADQSNNDSNKGIVNNFYEYYQPLVNHMQGLNRNRYRLIHYFDRDPMDKEL
jgi:hypothetical protein